MIREMRLINETIIFTNFILETVLNMVALEESEPLGTSQYPFYIDIRLEFASLSDPVP